MRIFLIALVASLLGPSPSFAAGVTPPNSTPKISAYCSTIDAALGPTGDGSQLINEIQAKCQPGDLLQFPHGLTFVMVTLCDFNRTIVSGETIACVYAGVRPMR